MTTYPKPDRIYVVEVVDGIIASAARLVRAPTKLQAINHVRRDTIQARVASQDDLVRIASNGGLKVEDARGGDEPDEE
jgi:hypothetical protein